jgi:hypothetical protein
MAYSDYGSFNWAKENGEWIYHPEFEDRSLISPQAEKILENIYGLKLDAVKQSQEDEQKYKDLPCEVKGVHHSVIGDLEGFAVVSYKGSPVVLWKGKKIDKITHDDVWNTEYVDGEEVKKPNFTPKIIEKTEGDYSVKVLIDDSYNYWSIAYIKNKNEEYIGMCGYGLGAHWWLNDEGQVDVEGDDDKTIWPREKECLEKSLKLLNK